MENWQKRALVYGFTTATALAVIDQMKHPSFEYEAKDHIDGYVVNGPYKSEQTLSATSDEGIKYTFKNFPGLTASELDALVETYHDHFYPSAYTAHFIHYTPMDLERLLEGKNVIDYVTSLKVDHEYSYAEFTQLMNAESTQFVASLDPHSQYMQEQRAQIFSNTYFRNLALNFTYESSEDGYVITALDNSSTSPTRFELGDVITALDNLELTSKDSPDLSALIAAIEEDQDVNFTVKRQGIEAPVMISIPRKEMSKTPLNSLILDKDKLYIKLDSVTQGSDKFIRQTYKSAMDLYGDKITSIILDLKDNGGGSVDAAHKIIDAFTTQADLGSVTVRNSTPITLGEMLTGGYKTHLTQQFQGRPEQLSDLPMAVLINSNTASAAEMIAGALQDFKRASIFGATNSHGKATMQKMYALTTAKQERISLSLTTGILNRPNGLSHQAVGISPDVKTPLTKSQQMRKQAFDERYFTQHGQAPLYFENQYENYVPNPTQAKATPSLMTCTITDETTSYGVALQNIDNDKLLASNIVGNNELICALDYLTHKSKPIAQSPAAPKV